jgi:hypothetical protein
MLEFKELTGEKYKRLSHMIDSYEGVPGVTTKTKEYRSSNDFQITVSNLSNGGWYLSIDGFRRGNLVPRLNAVEIVRDMLAQGLLNPDDQYKTVYISDRNIRHIASEKSGVN